MPGTAPNTCWPLLVCQGLFTLFFSILAVLPFLFLLPPPAFLNRCMYLALFLLAFTDIFRVLDIIFRVFLPSSVPSQLFCLWKKPAGWMWVSDKGVLFLSRGADADQLSSWVLLVAFSHVIPGTGWKAGMGSERGCRTGGFRFLYDFFQGNLFLEIL